ncbi:MAG: homoserine O-acetyltransferase [Gammaproteobacteria bacterium]|nr:homoserine O-acetyltransferase [Gammaproteobacteria bacterium]
MKLSFKASHHKEDGTHFLQVEEPFHFWSGGSIPAVTLAYETWGELNEDRSNAILILTGLSPNAHAASNGENPEPGWWEPMIGPGKAIDTNRHHVICLNSLGSCQGSTGPGCVNPETGEPYRLSFPDLTIQDIARTAAMVLEYLQIDQLRALVGPSMGGMSCLALLRQDPGIARHFLGISTAARAEPFAIAIRSLQREMIVRDPHWQDGAYTEEDWPETGMRMARKLGMLSYRSEPELRQRFGRSQEVHFSERLFGMHFSVESYLENAARKFIRNFEPCCYLFLSQSIDFFDLSEGYAGMQDAFADLKIDTAKVIGVHTDYLWPPHQQKEIADCLAKAGVESELQLLDSIQGHDSFMVDYDRFIPAVAEYLDHIV